MRRMALLSVGLLLLLAAALLVISRRPAGDVVAAGGGGETARVSQGREGNEPAAKSSLEAPAVDLAAPSVESGNGFASYGVVTNEVGEPLEGVSVSVYTREMESALTSAEGARALPRDGSFGDEKVAAGTEGLELILGEKLVTLRGYVVDRVTQQPISQGSVLVPAQRRTVPIVDGRFEVGLRPGSYHEILISSEGYLTSSESERELPVEPEFVERIYALSRGGAIVGRVLDRATQTPLGDARVVKLENELGQYDADAPQDRTEDDGRFRLQKVPGGRNLLEIVPPPPLPRRRVYVTVQDNQETDMGDILLNSGATVTVFVREMPNDTPAVDQEVTLSGFNRVQTNVMGRTDAEGRAVFANVASGTYRAKAGGNSTAVDRVRDDEEREVHLRIGGETIRGRLLRGGMAFGADLEFTSFRNGSAPLRSGRANPADGQFEIQRLFPGAWSVDVYPEPATQPGERSMPFRTSVTIVSGEELVINYPAGEIAVSVVGAGGGPVVGADVIVQIADETSTNPRVQQTGSDGRFFVRGLQRGRYHIIARKEGMITETLDVDVASDDAISKYVMTLRDGGTGALESYAFILTDGEPLREAWCRVYTEEGLIIAPPETRRDYRGRLRFANLPAGKYRTETGWWDFSSGFQNIEIKPGETTVIEDVLHESGSFRWTLHDSTGSPLVGVSCTVEPLESESMESTHSGVTDRAGKFELRALHPGVYRATANMEDGSTLATEFDVRAGEHTVRTSGWTGSLEK